MFKQIKLFAIGVFCLLLTYAKARSISVSQIGDVKIEVTDDNWQCDQIECPADTHRCFVSKENDSTNPSTLQHLNICYSKDNQVLKKYEITETIDPKKRVKLQINSYRSGIISSSNFSSSHNKRSAEGMQQQQQNYHKEWHFDLSKMRKEQVNDINKDVNITIADMNKDLDKLDENLEN